MAGTWKTLGARGTAPTSPSTMLLLMDGSVLCQDYRKRTWYRLTPDGDNYDGGTWTAAGSTDFTRLFFASAVLPNGKVLVVGGEYSNDPATPNGEDSPRADIFDPETNTWANAGNPFDWICGDVACCMLSDGRVLLGALDARTAIFDPASNRWSAGPTKGSRCNEETWTLLPDGSVLTVDCWDLDNSNRFVPAPDRWLNDSSLPVRLVDFDGKEIGPALLLPDGRVFAIGGTGHTAFYRPPVAPAVVGSWVQGPDLVDASKYLLTALDAPAVLLPNGKILCVAGYRMLDDSKADRSYWSYPCLTFEIDPAVASASVIPAVNAPKEFDDAYTFLVRFLLVPGGDTGQVLCAIDGNPSLLLYTPDAGPAASWRPVVQSINAPADPATGRPTLRRSTLYTVSGLRLNGWSQAVSYGDDYTAATNYPLALLSIGGKVYFCKTSNPSSMGVATGNAVVSVQLTIPGNVPLGQASILVLANAIRSAPFDILVVA